MKGEVIGINTMIIAGGTGIGFAIPVDLARGIIAQLKDSGSVSRGWLGVSIQDITPGIAEYYGIEEKSGVLVADVFPGDPADVAGIRAEDVIVAVNGERVTTSRELTGLIAGIGVGKTTEITVLRSGREKNFQVEVGRRPDKDLASKGTMKEPLGISIANLTSQMMKQFGLSSDKGVIVVAVQGESKAQKAGIRKGDIILKLNRKAVGNLEDFNRLIGETDDGDTVTFLIKRPGEGLMVISLTR
jgi:serine protease Do